MGKTQGEPVLYNWTPPSLLWVLPSIIPWLIVIILILKSMKKDRRVLGILIPLIISILLLVIVNLLLPQAWRDITSLFITSLILSQASIWLILGRFTGMNRFRVFLQTMFIMLLFGFFFLNNFESQQRSDKTGFMILYLISTLTMHLSMILSRFLVRKRFSPIRFTILGPFLNILIVLLMFFIVIFIAILASNTDASLDLFLQGLIISSVMGLILFITVLPYLILIFKNGYFREIFNRIFRLQAVLPLSSDRFESLEKMGTQESGENHE